MTKDEALKRALEALEDACGDRCNAEYNPCFQREAIIAIKEALAQPEPVAWLLTDKNINSLQVDSIQRLIDHLKHAHHTDLCVRINGQDEWFQADWLKHMVRVTPPQPEQEPVGRFAKFTDGIWREVTDGSAGVLLYTTTPQRTWVSLTDEDIALIDWESLVTKKDCVLAIEAALRSKNEH